MWCTWLDLCWDGGWLIREYYPPDEAIALTRNWEENQASHFTLLLCYCSTPRGWSNLFVLEGTDAMNQQPVVWEAWVLCNKTSAEVCFAAFWAVIGFGGCGCTNGMHSICSRDSGKAEWFSWSTMVIYGVQNTADTRKIHTSEEHFTVSTFWQRTQCIDAFLKNPTFRQS